MVYVRKEKHLKRAYGSYSTVITGPPLYWIGWSCDWRTDTVAKVEDEAEHIQHGGASRDVAESAPVTHQQHALWKTFWSVLCRTDHCRPGQGYEILHVFARSLAHTHTHTYTHTHTHSLSFCGSVYMYVCVNVRVCVCLCLSVCLSIWLSYISTLDEC